MANQNRPNGFKPVHGEDYKSPTKWPVAASQTIKIGDPVLLDSAGRVIIAVSNSSTALLGTAQTPVTASSAGDPIYIWDNPNQQFSAQISTGTLTDPYTTATATACFDLAGTTGAFYVNAAASAQDLFKVVGIDKDPVTGIDSEYATYQRVIVKINEGKHQLGVHS